MASDRRVYMKRESLGDRSRRSTELLGRSGKVLDYDKEEEGDGGYSGA